MRAMEFTKEACVARNHLKKRASEDHHKLKSSEAVYQKLMSSKVEDHQKLKNGSFRVVKSCYSYAYDC